MNILNIHTHDTSAHDAVISVSPSCFNPQPEQLYSVGIHPWDTADNLLHEWELLESCCHHQQVVAIGETGLDTLRGAPLDIQIEVFKRHIVLAEQLGKPLIVHCVRAWQELITAWRLTSPHKVSLAVHGFRGNANVAKSLLDQGFYLSYGEKFNADALRITPHDRILIETDESDASLTSIARQLAQALAMSTEQFTTLASDNAHKFISNNFRSYSLGCGRRVEM